MKAINNVTATEIKAAKRMAMNFIYCNRNLMYSNISFFKYDRRTRVGNIAAQIVRSTSIDAQAILIKRHERAKRKQVEFINAFQQPLVRDWVANKHNVQYINDTHLHFFDGRNHFAKNEFDRKFLAVLKAHRNFRNEIQKQA